MEVQPSSKDPAAMRTSVLRGSRRTPAFAGAGLGGIRLRRKRRESGRGPVGEEHDRPARPGVIRQKPGRDNGRRHAGKPRRKPGRGRRPHLVDLTSSHGYEIVPTPTDWMVNVVAELNFTLNMRVVLVAMVIVAVSVTPAPATRVVVPPEVLVICSM